MASAWLTITVKVTKDPSNEADPWRPPTPGEVAAEVRTHMEGRDLDTGWTITKVSS